MPIVPILKPREVVKNFEMLGWEVVRQRGSHIILTKVGHSDTINTKQSRGGSGHVANSDRKSRVKRR